MQILNGEKLSLVDSKIFSEYIHNGLTYKSDDVNIIPRDSAGNILLTEGSQSNQLLIIEPIVKNFNTKSLLRVYNTNFQYYTFPVSTVTKNNTTDFDLDINISDIILDPIYARYKPTTDFTPAPTLGTYSGILMDEVVDGLPQTNTNCYTVSKEAKNSGNDLRFRVKLAHNFNSSETYGTIYWSIMKTGPNTGGLDREWLSGYASSTTVTPVYNAIKDVNAKAWTALTDQRKNDNDQFRQPYSGWSLSFQSSAAQIISPIDISITSLTGGQLDIINKILNLDPKKVPDDNETSYKKKQLDLQTALDSYNIAIQDSEAIYGSILQYTTQNAYIDETISNSEFEIGDIFQIGVRTDNDGHTVLNEQSYWVITDASKTVDEWNQEILD